MAGEEGRLPEVCPWVPALLKWWNDTSWVNPLALTRDADDDDHEVKGEAGGKWEWRRIGKHETRHRSRSHVRAINLSLPPLPALADDRILASTMSADFWAGYVSGAAGIIIGNPLDLLKVRSQAGISAGGGIVGHFESIGTLVRGVINSRPVPSS